ncbi:MAG: hypothetical protein JSV06_10740 [Myxococcales bacterium]|nr:MAG: hypothetical protein JSV06_10740 [Myxococcales bacterium]
MPGRLFLLPDRSRGLVGVGTHPVRSRASTCELRHVDMGYHVKAKFWNP